MPKRIEIIIDEDGTLSGETKGFAGKTCKDASKFIEDSLGQKTSDVNTKEYYQAIANKNKENA